MAEAESRGTEGERVCRVIRAQVLLFGGWLLVWKHLFYRGVNHEQEGDAMARLTSIRQPVTLALEPMVVPSFGVPEKWVRRPVMKGME